MAGNAYALPRFAGRLIYRPSEARRRFSSGVTLYPLVLLIFTLPDRLDIVAAAWGSLPSATGWPRSSDGMWAGRGFAGTHERRSRDRPRSLSSEERRELSCAGGAAPRSSRPPTCGTRFGIPGRDSQPPVMYSHVPVYRMMFLAQVGFAMAYLL